MMEWNWRDCDYAEVEDLLEDVGDMMREYGWTAEDRKAKLEEIRQWAEDGGREAGDSIDIDDNIPSIECHEEE